VLAADDEDLVKPQEGNKIFDETTIAFPIDLPIEESVSSASASVTTSEPKKDENGLLIETTTGGGPSNRVKLVHETVQNSGRLPDNDELTSEALAEQKNLEEPGEDKTARLDDADQEQTTEISSSTDKPDANSTSAAVGAPTDAEETEGVPFPVTDLLNGIYNFVSSYIKPKPAAKPEPEAAPVAAVVVPAAAEKVSEDEDDTEAEIEVEAVSRSTLIGPQPLNAHTIPRDQLIIEAVDEEHSDSDPFFQVSNFPTIRQQPVPCWKHLRPVL